ncbi:MAG: hypothetical protein ACREXY_21565 [Gammaproteobacteria bacterium]
MDNAAQTPHRQTQGDMAITPVNGMPLPSKGEPGKRAGSLLVCWPYERHPEPGRIHPEAAVRGVRIPGASYCLRGGRTQTN